MRLGVIIDGGVALLKSLRVGGLSAVGAKPLVIRVGCRALHVHIVVAGQDRIVQVRIVEDLHGLISHLPFALHVPLVYNITQVSDEVHVQLVLMVH